MSQNVLPLMLSTADENGLNITFKSRSLLIIIFKHAAMQTVKLEKETNLTLEYFYL